MCRILHIGEHSAYQSRNRRPSVGRGPEGGAPPDEEGTVTVALQEYIEHRKQQEILSLFGRIDYEPGYDYKRERKAKRI